MSDNPEPIRRPHAALDPAGRREKAIKIERLLGLGPTDRPRRLLEVGTGSGAIAHYFASHPTLAFEVTGVDVADQRIVTDGYEFSLVTDTRLPYEDSSFDVVISNHVLEHVGSRSNQLKHLSEIGRVLRTDGVGYLATPNRWALIEPHYGLAGLSWIPESLRSSYLRFAGRGELYDCSPVGWRQLDEMLKEVGLQFDHVEAKALRTMLDVEQSAGIARRGIAKIPDKFVQLLGPALPTHICVLSLYGHGSCRDA